MKNKALQKHRASLQFMERLHALTEGQIDLRSKNAQAARKAFLSGRLIRIDRHKVGNRTRIECYMEEGSP